MKCPNCGSEMPLEYRFCPYCGAKNQAAEQHAADMAKYESEFARTKAEVENRSRHYGTNLVKAVAAAVLVILIIITMVINNNAWSFRRDLIRRQAEQHYDTVSESLCQSLAAGNYAEFSAFMDHYGLNYIYDSPFTTESPQIMCDKAQIACERLSNDYQTTFSWYDKALMDKIDAEKNIVDEFENALENRQFKIYLQPQLAFVGTEQEKYFGAEVIVCWEHPQHGTLMPETFLPTLEKTGLIYRLDRFVWEEAAKKLYEWNERGFQNQTVSVNISQKDIYYIDVYKTFTELVEKYNIKPMQMNIEISESGFMSDFEGSKKLFEKLQSFGFKVEIDDFGSGYSSLNMLKDIHADVLKIGRSFLNESENKERSNTILYTIIDMAKSLGMDVLAVGVESESQMNLMKTLGCESFQGFYFSKPVPVESFERMYL